MTARYKFLSNHSKFWRYSYLLITALFIFSFVINYFGWQFTGYWTEKVIAWIWLFYTGIILIVRFTPKHLKYYSISIILIIFITFMSMGFIPIGFLVYILPESEHQNIQINQDYRIQVGKKIMATFFTIYEKHGIFEKRLYRMTYQQFLIGLFKSYQINNNPPIQKATFNHLDNDKLYIDYQILNQSKKVYHYHRAGEDIVVIDKN